jgi:predicted metal-dependent hydrolase
VVLYPRSISLAKAETLVRSKTDWISARLKEVGHSERAVLARAANGERMTRHHRVRFVEGDAGSVTLRVTGVEILLRYPRGSAPDSPPVRRAVWRGIIEACRREARAYLPDRVAALAEQHGFRAGRVTIKNLRSRWGSCSSRGNINLNLRLMQLPDHLIDYVILHELMHTLVRHHGRDFWTKFQTILPHARALDTELNRHHLTS